MIKREKKVAVGLILSGLISFSSAKETSSLSSLESLFETIPPSYSESSSSVNTISKIDEKDGQNIVFVKGQDKKNSDVITVSKPSGQNLMVNTHLSLPENYQAKNVSLSEAVSRIVNYLQMALHRQLI